LDNRGTGGYPVLPNREESLGALLGGIGAVPLLLSSPAAAFERLAERPRWLGLLMLCAASAGLSAWIALTPTLEAEAEIARKVVERFDLTPEQAEEVRSGLTDPAAPGAGEVAKRVGGAAVGTAVALLAGMMLFHGIVRMAGPAPALRRSASVFFLAAVAIAAGAVLRGVLVRLAGTIDVTLGPGALVPDLDPASVTAALLNVFDVFSVLHLWLLATGTGVALGATAGTAWAIAGAWWILKSLVVFSLMLFRVWISGNL